MVQAKCTNVTDDRPHYEDMCTVGIDCKSDITSEYWELSRWWPGFWHHAEPKDNTLATC